MRSDKKEKKNLVPIFVIIAIIIIIAIVVVIKVKDNKNKPKQIDEFVSQSSDGTKTNTSDKLHEAKTFEGIEISEIDMIQKSSSTTSLVGTIKNISDTVQGDYNLNLKILDKDGKELLSIPVYIPTLQPGASTPLTSTTSYDLINAYDIVLEK